MTTLTTTIKKEHWAVITIVLTVFALAFGDALIKGASGNLTLWQIFILRSIVVIPTLICIIKLIDNAQSIWPKRLGWTLLRSNMLSLMWIAYYIALPHVNLSIAAASYYTLPLFITIFAAFFLNDTIRWAGWLAIVLGFIGVIFILEPRAEDFNWFAILPVFSAILYALSMILTRSHCQTENVFVLSLWLNISMLAMGLIASLFVYGMEPDAQLISRYEFLLGSWGAMDINQWVAIGILAVAILTGSIGAAYAYQNAPPAIIATFDFTYVGFAVFWGFFLFSEIPSTNGMLGILLIVVAGILAVRKPK
ncbi:MAG: DMT family transporter [Desulfovibrionales bacterium]|nr:DMT family transporter [Desulfovibrionales bacterium]